MNIKSHELRSNIHILEYFILGLAMLLFGASRGWKISTGILVCGIISLFDETLKIWLPTREFDVIDLMKDWAGVGVAVLLTQIVSKVKAVK